jgi:hypothetical protein
MPATKRIQHETFSLSIQDAGGVIASQFCTYCRRHLTAHLFVSEDVRVCPFASTEFRPMTEIEVLAIAVPPGTEHQ